MPVRVRMGLLNNRFFGMLMVVMIFVPMQVVVYEFLMCMFMRVMRAEK